MIIAHDKGEFRLDLMPDGTARISHQRWKDGSQYRTVLTRAQRVEAALLLLGQSGDKPLLWRPLLLLVWIRVRTAYYRRKLDRMTRVPDGDA